MSAKSVAEALEYDRYGYPDYSVETVDSLPTPDDSMVGRIVIKSDTGVPYICVPA